MAHVYDRYWSCCGRSSIESLSISNFKDIADGQKSDADFDQIMHSVLLLEQVKLYFVIYRLGFNVRLFHGHIGKLFFYNFYSFSHPGIRVSAKLVSSKFIWPSINKDI